VLTEERQVTRVTVLDFARAIEPVARVRMPKSFNSRVPAQRRDMASRMRERLRDVDRAGAAAIAADGEAEPGDGATVDGRRSSDVDTQLESLRMALRGHPCDTCPEREQHARWAQRYLELEHKNEGMRRAIESRTNTLGRDFDRVCRVLDALGYLRADELTEAGRMLRTIYTELDLLLAEALRAEVFAGLSAAELAGCVAAVVYEPRGRELAAPEPPTSALRVALDRLGSLWVDLHAAEAAQRLSFLRPMDTGFVSATYLWARGARLEEAMAEGEFAAGDFVRWTKQVVDVLGQLVDAAGDELLRSAAREAIRAVRRGLVAHGGE
jgi:ATP-dependent RNA helicase HelY